MTLTPGYICLQTKLRKSCRTKISGRKGLNSRLVSLRKVQSFNKQFLIFSLIPCHRSFVMDNSKHICYIVNTYILWPRATQIQGNGHHHLIDHKKKNHNKHRNSCCSFIFTMKRQKYILHIITQWLGLKFTTPLHSQSWHKLLFPMWLLYMGSFPFNLGSK